jgi:SAM-dependent methyltransferase
MSVYQRLLGLPFVYGVIRPLVVGGIDMTPAYRLLEAGPVHVVVDVGCGTGDALRYLDSFAAYHGFDIDAAAVAYARRRHGREGVQFHERALGPEDLARLHPDRIMMNGLLHHLSDADAIGLLRMCVACPSVRRIATCDIVYRPGRLVNNVLARLDRGRHCRHEEGYRALARAAGLRLVRDAVVPCHPRSGRADYFLMALEPAAPAERG